MLEVLKRKLREKFNSNTGESLIETLVTVLIIVMMMEMVAGAVISAAKVNDKADNSANTLSVQNAETIDKTITITFQSESVGKSTGDGGDFSVSNTPIEEGKLGVKIYKSGDYYFYEPERAD